MRWASSSSSSSGEDGAADLRDFGAVGGMVDKTTDLDSRRSLDRSIGSMRILIHRLNFKKIMESEVFIILVKHKQIDKAVKFAKKNKKIIIDPLSLI